MRMATVITLSDVAWLTRRIEPRTACLTIYVGYDGADLRAVSGAGALRPGAELAELEEYAQHAVRLWFERRLQIRASVEGEPPTDEVDAETPAGVAAGA